MARVQDVDVLIMAAGSSRRLGGPLRKQWLPVGGLPLFLYTANRMRACGMDAITLVVHADDCAHTSEWIEQMGVSSHYRVVAGGNERQDSVWAGLQVATRTFVAIHDAARPQIMLADVEAVLASARLYGAATLGHPTRDSLMQVDHDGQIVDVVSRTGVWQVQTPQVARRDWLLHAHDQARTQGLTATDDTAVLRAAGYPVKVVRGSAWNAKVTELEDVHYLLEVLAKEEG